MGRSGPQSKQANPGTGSVNSSPGAVPKDPHRAKQAVPRQDISRQQASTQLAHVTNSTSQAAAHESAQLTQQKLLDALSGAVAVQEPSKQQGNSQAQAARMLLQQQMMNKMQQSASQMRVPFHTQAAAMIQEQLQHADQGSLLPSMDPGSTHTHAEISKNWQSLAPHASRLLQTLRQYGAGNLMHLLGCKRIGTNGNLGNLANDIINHGQPNHFSVQQTEALVDQIGTSPAAHLEALQNIKET